MGLTVNGWTVAPISQQSLRVHALRSRKLGEMARLTMLSELTSKQFLGEIETSLAIYADAMEVDASWLPGRRDLMRRHAGYPAFRALQAKDVSDEQIVGFAYGFHGQGGQWWYDAVWTALAGSAGISSAASWLADCLEIAEVHVYKTHQRAGIGTRMLTALTSGRPERTAVLSTPDRDSTARRLYRRMGFSELLAGYNFPGGSPPYVVMGAELPLRDPTAAPIRPLSASPSIS
jgi:GNAT superfamily N-acetyltransferase